jgi:hypothetical protein
MIELVPTSEVRAVLGVSSKELTDATLSSSIYSVRLREGLRDIHPQLLADFARINESGEPSDEQERFLELTSSYATYHVASQCLAALPMFAPQLIADEKAQLQRIADPFKQVREDVPTVLAMFKVKLQEAYAAVNSDAPAPNLVARTFVVTTGLAADPVTGA